jgi:riboflavin kinase, archaea type
LPTITIAGTVFSGKGKGKKFVELSWFKRQVEEKLGFSPYLGTLNLRLLEKEVEKRELLETKGGVTVEPQTGYYSGILFRSTIEGLECAVVIPIMPNYPNDVLEVISPVYLRGKVKLADGSSVTVSINV